MDWIYKVETPCYVIDEKQLRKKSSTKYFSKAYSYKSMPLVSPVTAIFIKHPAT